MDKILRGNTVSENYDIINSNFEELKDTISNTNGNAVTSVNGQKGDVTINIETGSGSSSIQQVSDSSYTSGLSVKSKNANAYAQDNTITDTEEIGAVGSFAAALGGASQAKGKRSVAEGTTTLAKGNYSHAEGNASVTLSGGVNAHAEGLATTAGGNSSHSEGRYTQALGTSSHAEGGSTIAKEEYTHAEGNSTTASGRFAHAEGNSTTASGEQSHTEGIETKATMEATHAEGSKTIASGMASHSEGISTKATGEGSHAEGQETTASGYAAHSEGYSNVASGAESHAEGNSTTASGEQSHAEGQNTTASGIQSHTEGLNTKATSDQAHSEGMGSEAQGSHSHAEGYYSKTLIKLPTSSSGSGSGSTDSTEDTDTDEGIVYDDHRGENAHAEGCRTTAIGYSSHTEGYKTTATGYMSHAEGDSTSATGNESHAEGYKTVASGNKSHAEGGITTAKGMCSHAGGDNTIAGYDYQTAIGKYNNNNSDTLFEVGNGSSSARSNALEVHSDGRATVYGKPTGDNDVVRLTDIPVTSVNGKTGAVTISTGVSSVNGSTGAVKLTPYDILGENVIFNCSSTERSTIKTVSDYPASLGLYNGLTIRVRFEYANTADTETYLKLGSIGVSYKICSSTGVNIVYPLCWFPGEIVTLVLQDSVWYIVSGYNYPIGSLFITTRNAPPASLFGGSWTQITDKVLFARGSTYTAGSLNGGTDTTNTIKYVGFYVWQRTA